MRDTIYREDAIEAIKDNSFALGDDYMEINGYGAIDDIRALPSADRPRGVWKAKSFHEYICDNCGFSFDMMKCDFLENMKYCPNCGVRKGANNENKD